MKAEDIILELIQRLPHFSDSFSTESTVNTMIRAADDKTVQVHTFEAHGLSVDDTFTVVNATTPIQITAVKSNNDDDIVTVGALQSHQITLNTDNARQAGMKLYMRPDEGVTVTDAPEWIDNPQEILQVVNRKEITFLDTYGKADGTFIGGGAVYLLHSKNDNMTFPAARPQMNFSGTFRVNNIISNTAFEYDSGLEDYSGALDPIPTDGTTIKIRGRPRISGGVDFDTIMKAYSEQKISDRWAFVFLNDVDANNARRIAIDAPSNFQPGQDYQQILIQPCSVVVFSPCSDQVAARKARDESHNEIFNAVNRSILMKNFDSYTGQTTHGTFLNFDSHRLEAYNGAVYAHTFRYNLITRLQFEDTVQYAEDVAFRDIDLTLYSNFDEIQVAPFDSTHSDINLDDEEYTP